MLDLAESRDHPPSRRATLDVSRLSIAFHKQKQLINCVTDVSFTIRRGEVFALVGESGSGKTMIARSIPRLLPPGAVLTGGEITLNEVELTRLSRRVLRRVRGKQVGMIFQEPMVALNPSLRVGVQIREALHVHYPGHEHIDARIVEMLDRLHVSNPRLRLHQYPHELSGGLRQRIMIAAVLLLKPSLVIADEPTTALDAIVQREVMELMLESARDVECAVLLITHDLGVVADYAQRVLVIHQGEAVEQGFVSDVVGRPKHPCTIRLLEALPTEQARSRSESRVPWLIVDKARVVYAEPRKWPWRRAKTHAAVEAASFDLSRGECLAVVGESGSGKTTIGRAILGLVPTSSGTITLGGATLSDLNQSSWQPFRRRLQLIFQDPYSSLNPRMRVEDIVAEGLRSTGLDVPTKADRVAQALDEVGLSEAFRDRYPHQLSGGQRQRVGIARALVLNPDLVIADEPVAALDLTVQAQILSLLQRLQRERGFTLIFISHDLSVVSQIADRVCVMLRGYIVEYGPVDVLFKHAAHPYSRVLIEAAPYLSVNSATGVYTLSRHHPVPPASAANCTYFDPATESHPRYLRIGADHRVAICANGLE